MLLAPATLLFFHACPCVVPAVTLTNGNFNPFRRPYTAVACRVLSSCPVLSCPVQERQEREERQEEERRGRKEEHGKAEEGKSKKSKKAKKKKNKTGEDYMCIYRCPFLPVFFVFL